MNGNRNGSARQIRDNYTMAMPFCPFTVEIDKENVHDNHQRFFNDGQDLCPDMKFETDPTLSNFKMPKFKDIK